MLLSARPIGTDRKRGRYEVGEIGVPALPMESVVNRAHRHPVLLSNHSQVDLAPPHLSAQLCHLFILQRTAALSAHADVLLCTGVAANRLCHCVTPWAQTWMKALRDVADSEDGVPVAGVPAKVGPAHQLGVYAFEALGLVSVPYSANPVQQPYLPGGEGAGKGVSCLSPLAAGLAEHLGVVGRGGYRNVTAHQAPEEARTRSFGWHALTISNSYR